MKCKFCKEETIAVKTSGGKDIIIDFNSITGIEREYLIMIDAEKHPLSYKEDHHTVHFVTHPECKIAWMKKKGIIKDDSFDK